MAVINANANSDGCRADAWGMTTVKGTEPAVNVQNQLTDFYSFSCNSPRMDQASFGSSPTEINGNGEQNTPKPQTDSQRYPPSEEVHV